MIENTWPLPPVLSLFLSGCLQVTGFHSSLWMTLIRSPPSYVSVLLIHSSVARIPGRLQVLHNLVVLNGVQTNYNTEACILNIHLVSAEYIPMSRIAGLSLFFPLINLFIFMHCFIFGQHIFCSFLSLHVSPFPFLEAIFKPSIFIEFIV